MHNGSYEALTSGGRIVAAAATDSYSTTKHAGPRPHRHPSRVATKNIQASTVQRGSVLQATQARAQLLRQAVQNGLQRCRQCRVRRGLGDVPGITGQGCWTVAGFGGKFPVQTCSEGSWIDQSILSLPHTSNEQTTSTYPVHAPMIEIRWQSSDRPTTLTSDSGSMSRPQATVTTPEKTSGLSTGAKVAIGVVIPVVIIAAFFAALISWRRYRRRQLLRDGGDQIEKSELRAESLALQNVRVESDGRSIHELEGQGDHKELGGADIVSHERYELPAECS